MNNTNLTPQQLKYLTPLQLKLLKLLSFISKAAPVMVIFMLLGGAYNIRVISALQPDTNGFAESYRTDLWLGVACSLVGALLWIMMPSFFRSMYRWAIKHREQKELKE